MIVIMISGQARVGKTTLSNFIAEYCVHNNLTPKIIPFALSIKKQAALEGYTKHSNQEAYRDFCQHLGQGMRDANPDHWVNEWEKSVKDVYEEEVRLLNEQPEFYKERVVLVDDCRYANELDIGKKYKAIDIFISAGTRKLEEHDAEWRKHRSEELAYSIDRQKSKVIDRFYHHIYNENNLEDFKKFCTRQIPTWLGLVADNNKANCNCELCRADRENRHPNNNTVLEETLDYLMDKLPENWFNLGKKEDKDDKDPN